MNHTSGIRELFFETLDDKAVFLHLAESKGLYSTKYDANTV